jgi:hypothetical protein
MKPITQASKAQRDAMKHEAQAETGKMKAKKDEMKGAMRKYVELSVQVLPH